MLKSYEVTIEGDRIKWQGEKPKISITNAIIIIEENEATTTSKAKRFTPTHLKGQVKMLGDIVSPIVDELEQALRESH